MSQVTMPQPESRPNLQDPVVQIHLPHITYIPPTPSVISNPPTISEKSQTIPTPIPTQVTRPSNPIPNIPPRPPKPPKIPVPELFDPIPVWNY